MIGFVIVIIMFAIIFALIGISYRNDFIVRKEDINKCRSNERLKRQQYLDAAKRVKALAKEFVGIDTKANVEMINANNNGSNFYIGGQKYPNYQGTQVNSKQLFETHYEPWIKAKEELIMKIAEYNKAISVFPGSVYASLFGFVREPLVGEDQLWEANELELGDDDQPFVSYFS